MTLPFTKDERPKLNLLEALTKNEFVYFQFPSRFIYNLPPEAEKKDLLKKIDPNKIFDNKEILQYHVQHVCDSTGNQVTKNFTNIDHYATVSEDLKEANVGYQLGKIQIYNDGTAKFVCGDLEFDVLNGIQSNCKQELMTIDH